MTDNNHYAVVAPGYIRSQVKNDPNDFYLWTAAYNATGAAAAGATSQTTIVRDMSGTSIGAVMVINAGTTLTPFYQRAATVDLRATYKVSFNTYVVNSPVWITLDIRDVANNAVLGTVNAGYTATPNLLANWGMPQNCTPKCLQ
ncbi:hypothetical protein ASG31_17355 [Chryseobacterium sp. Leaf404]|uniref:hypothetical protein n=1 Tax=unclassified Chryseobacterium TaxID=2593645 RepID=UPI000700D560|nr:MULTISPECIES: hypothetical protein [unclassified Chryseobacterium]KQT20534.1 hypothetical protein ASG31_17355 [Chryseobacterium sp. Leaf404]